MLFEAIEEVRFAKNFACCVWVCLLFSPKQSTWTTFVEHLVEGDHKGVMAPYQNGLVICLGHFFE